MKFDFASIFKYIQLVPIVVAGIEKLHGDTQSGATKKQLAQESLALATGVAGIVLPNNADQVNASGAAASALIDSTVAMFNATGLFQKKTK